MMQRNNILPFVLLSLFVFGCSAGGATPAAPAGGIHIAGFDSLTFNAPGILEITQGESESLEISGDPALTAFVQAQVVDHRLVISATSAMPSNASITYKLFVKDINEIVLDSFGVIKIPALKADRLGLEINGSGRIQAGEIDANALTVKINGSGSFSADAISSASVEFSARGAGNISIAGGSADQLNLEMESGAFIGDNFKSLSAVVTVNGTGTVLVWAVQKLDVTVNGAGSVTYYGEPTMNMSMNGGGQIRGGGRK